MEELWATDYNDLDENVCENCAQCRTLVLGILIFRVLLSRHYRYLFLLFNNILGSILQTDTK
jgi:hypothetical protein